MVGGATDPPSGATRERVQYREAGAAIRQMQTRMVDVSEDLQPVDWRVGMAVIALVASWSRLGDQFFRDEVAHQAGCNPQTAGKSLSRLSRLGVIDWQPNKSKRDRSWLSIEVDHETASVSSSATHDVGHETAVVSDHETVAVSHVPRSGTEKSTEPPDPSAAKQVLSLIREHWPKAKGRINQRSHVDPLMALLASGWSWEQVTDLVSARTTGDDAPWSMSALTKRLQRVAHQPSYEEAMRDTDLLGFLNRLPKRNRSPYANTGDSRPRSQAEHAPSGRTAF